eukprot:1722001-Pleurochrysis_carterae.AAC.1
MEVGSKWDMGATEYYSNSAFTAIHADKGYVESPPRPDQMHMIGTYAGCHGYEDHAGYGAPRHIRMLYCKKSSLQLHVELVHIYVGILQYNTQYTQNYVHGGVSFTISRPVGLALYGQSNRKSVGLPEAVPLRSAPPTSDIVNV